MPALRAEFVEVHAPTTTLATLKAAAAELQQNIRLSNLDALLFFLKGKSQIFEEQVNKLLLVRWPRCRPPSGSKGYEVVPIG